MCVFLGVDTSCYTTSLALIDENGIVHDKRTVLYVAKNERGLRQSDAVFEHTRNLSIMIPELLKQLDCSRIAAVGVSRAPKDDEGSYMPVFLSGLIAARSIASALNVPLYENSHQSGHIRAALYKNEALMQAPFLGLHISGGTTELFRAEGYHNVKPVGGTSDLSAGQFVDRVGVSLGLGFPAGADLEKLAREADISAAPKLPARIKGLECSFSGVETMAQRLISEGVGKNELAYCVYDCLARTFIKLIIAACDSENLSAVLLAGGVMSSALLRELLFVRLKRAERDDIKLFFGENRLSSDNAVGAALIARDVWKANFESEIST